MKKLTRKLFISILAAVFAVVALGTSTFAWITVSNTALVDTFTGTVEAGKAGIELSSDNGQTWSTKINLQSLITSEFKGFSDITTADGKAFHDFDLGNGTAASNDKGIEGKYLSLTIKIRRSDYNEYTKVEPKAEKAPDANVFVDSTKVSFTAPEKVFPLDLDVASSTTAGTESPSNTYTKTQELKKLTVDNAARMAIICGSKVIAYEKAAETTPSTPLLDDNTVGYDKEGFAHLYALAKKIELPSKTDLVPTLEAGAGKAKSDLLVALPANNTAKDGVAVTINVWVEGWDNECHVNVLNQQLSVALGFITELGEAKQ